MSLDTELPSEMLKSDHSFKAENAAVKEERHRATLAYMQQISDSITSGVRSDIVPMPHRSSASTTKSGDKGSYYYRGHEIKNPEAVIGCIPCSSCCRL